MKMKIRIPISRYWMTDYMISSVDKVLWLPLLYLPRTSMSTHVSHYPPRLGLTTIRKESKLLPLCLLVCLYAHGIVHDG
jgi:hypothetical protein